MEDKKQIKISLKTAIMIILFILLVIFGLLFFIYYIQTTPSSNTTSTTGLTSTTTIYSDTKKDIPTNSNTKFTTYYAYTSEYSDYSSDVQLDNIFVTSPTELKQYLYKCIGTNVVSNVVYIKNGKIDTSISQYFDDDFFEDNNLAIEMYDSTTSHHSYSIASVIKNGVTATINIKDNFHTYGGIRTPRSTLVFIALDKEIQNVKFDIYRTTTNNSYDSDFGMMFIAGFVISIAVIIVVSLIISKHNRKMDNMSNSENNPKKFGIIIAILILVVIFFAIVFYEATMMPKKTI